MRPLPRTIRKHDTRTDCIRKAMHQGRHSQILYMGAMEETPQGSPANGSRRVPEMQGKKAIYKGNHSPPCKLCKKTSRACLRDMVRMAGSKEKEPHQPMP